MNYLDLAVLYAMAMIALTTISTGTTSATIFGPPQTALTSPTPQPTTTPDGPFMLSDHPGIGSAWVALTEIYYTQFPDMMLD